MSTRTTTTPIDRFTLRQVTGAVGGPMTCQQKEDAAEVGATMATTIPGGLTLGVAASRGRYRVAAAGAAAIAAAAAGAPIFLVRAFSPFHCGK